MDSFGLSTTLSGRSGVADKAKLTKRVVESITAEPGERVVVWDTDVSGFGIRVSSRGRTYFVRYRRGAGGRNARRADYTIGRHGAPWTVEGARKEAKRVLGQVADGEDPQAAKVAARTSGDGRTFEDAANVFLDRHVRRNLRPTTARDYERIIETKLVPAWRNRPVMEVDRADVLALLDKIEDRAPVMARLTFAVTRKLFGFALQRGLVHANPCDGLRGPKVPQARDRVLSDDELRLVWQATHRLGFPFGPVFRLLILTAQRRTEVGGMRWSEVDLDRAVWTIPAERAKNAKEHEVDLSAPVVAELRALPRLGEFVFGQGGDGPLQGWSRGRRRLDEAVEAVTAEEAAEAGVDPAPPAPWRLHDLRRTVATGLAGMGFGPQVVERVLNHVSGVQGGLTGVYQRHHYRPERKAALEAWAQHVEGLGADKPANVVELRPA